MSHKIEGTTVNAVRVDCALPDGHTGPCRPASPYEGMVVIVLSKTRARKLRAFLNRYQWRPSNSPDSANAAQEVLRQIKEQI